MNNVINQMPYLRTSREFPEEIHQLTVEINKSYLDIANVVNARTIGLFPTNRPAITGNSYFLTTSRQQTLRQVYIVPAGITTGSSINLGFKFGSIAQFTPYCYGTFNDGTNFYGLIFGSNVAIAGQVSFYFAPNGASTVSDQIIFEVGAGAPTVVSGIIVVEWISNT